MPTTQQQPTTSSSSTDKQNDTLPEISTLERLPNLAFYAVVLKLASKAEYVSGGGHGDILGVKNLDSNVEFVFSGVFQIAWNDFFFTPDAHFDPANLYNGHFSDIKLTCCLTQVKNDDFSFATKHYSTVIDNIRAFEKLAGVPNGANVISTIYEELGKPQIKIIHSLFEKKKEELDDDDDDDDERKEEGSTDNSTNTLENITPQFAMETWPVMERCRSELEDLLLTHDICPLEAYEEDSSRIPPQRHEARLKGTIVKVYLAFCHHNIKRQKKHIFQAVV
ncbi:hypothetical protein SCLCIDRAFT_23337 [Scleroderma citrinum Foug A]|uniref:Uncharacterized protein n=1 Tax=Scleroderma citrinum Foug A TaxID=1036808 RepID=A0A0C3AIA8_9AGAM|nr:hypothetical protein SCLCIDRAFT_23337 [Scleroderma citrinum Foug A]